jgi:hypothetical protein
LSLLEGAQSRSVKLKLLIPAFELAPINIERAVIEDPEARIKAAILKQVIPPLQRIQNFHDGLPSAVYASRFLRSIQALAQEFPDSACGQVLQALDQSLSPDQQWGCYTVEYYQTVVQLLSELVDRPSVTVRQVQSAIRTIEQISQTMTQPGIVNYWEVEE